MDPTEQARLLDESQDEIDEIEEDTFPAVRNAVEALDEAVQDVSENPDSEDVFMEAQMLADGKIHALDNPRNRGIRDLNAAAEELVGPADMASSWANTDDLSETLKTVFDKYEDIYFAFTYVNSSNITTPVPDKFLREAQRRVDGAKEALDALEPLFQQARSEFPDEHSLRRDFESAREERERQLAEDMQEIRDEYGQN